MSLAVGSRQIQIQISEVEVIDQLPHWNVLVNSISFACLLGAVGAARRKNIQLHKRLIAFALFFLVLFLVMYLTRVLSVGVTRYQGPSEWLPVYRLTLGIHTTLAVLLVVYFIPVTLRAAFRKDFERHRRIAPRAALCWILTALTSYLVYGFLYLL